MHRVGRWLASLARRAGFRLACHPAGPAVVVTTPPGPSRWTMPSPLPAPAGTLATSEPRVGARPHALRGWLRTMAAPARLPHTFQLCIHCQQNPAGFWVSRTGGKTARRPWCLSCGQGLDRDRFDMIPFGG